MKSCRRCIEAHRTCLGYQDESDLIFRRHKEGLAGSYSQSALEVFDKAPRICQAPAEIAWQDLGSALSKPVALTAFLKDYSVTPKDRAISRGYLDGVERLLEAAEPTSDIVQASQVMALVSLGKRLDKPSLVHKARLLYTKILGSFRKSLLNEHTARTIESLVTIVLLGVYEVRFATGYEVTRMSS